MLQSNTKVGFDHEAQRELLSKTDSFTKGASVSVNRTSIAGISLHMNVHIYVQGPLTNQFSAEVAFIQTSP